MTTQEAIKVVDAHHQKYEKSCSPSIIEILLKLECRVKPDYYGQQDAYKNQNIGLDFARGKTIEKVKFHQHNTQTDGPFITKIQDELNAGRFVGIYTLNDGSTTDYHGWVAVGIQNDKIILRSKYSELGNNEGRKTAEHSLNILEAVPPKMTDLVFYTLL
jgi:hypothetical protein